MSEENGGDAQRAWEGEETLETPSHLPYVAVEWDESRRYTRYDEVLGRGAFKTVYKASDQKEGLELAWNQVCVDELVTSATERERLFAEIRVLKHLKHKNIMTFYDSFTLDGPKGTTLNFVTELFTSGTLRQYRKKRKEVDDQVLKRWAWQILQGLVYLHGHNPPIIHRDLKCDNIFVNGASGIVKLGDLGLATLWRGIQTPQSVLGTPEFMAPELYEEKYNEKVDVYSFGMCMLELATMEYPYAECKNAAQIYRKVSMRVPPSGLAKVENQELREFIELCIMHDHEQRPEARQLLKHSFFESIRTGKMSCPGVDKAICERNQEDDGRTSPSEGGSSDEGCRGTETTSTLTAATEPQQQQQPELVRQPSRQPSPQPQMLQVTQTTTMLTSLSLNVISGYVSSSAGASPGITTPVERQCSTPGAVDLNALLSSGVLPDVSQHLERGTEGAHGEQLGREFFVSCKQAEQSKLGFQLRFVEPEGGCKTIEFAFDLDEDTADAIANEMMEDLALSALEAQCIASKITDEVNRMKAGLQQRQQQQEQLQQLSRPASPRPHSTSPMEVSQPVTSASNRRSMDVHFAVEDTAVPSLVLPQPQKAADAPKTMVSAVASSEVLPVLSRANTRPRSSREHQRSSEDITPSGNGSGKPPSIHELIAAMKEVHEELAEEEQIRADNANLLLENRG